MPPMLASAPGSIGKNRPVSRSASFNCLREMPGSTVTVRSSALIDEHPVHFGQIDRYAALHREQVAFQRRTVAIGNDRHIVLAAEPDDRLHFLRAAREDDGVGQLRIERGFVAAMMGEHGLRAGRYALAERGLERIEQGGGERTANSAVAERDDSRLSPGHRARRCVAALLLVGLLIDLAQARRRWRHGAHKGHFQYILRR